MLEIYKGLTVIVLYVDKLMDPLLVMSSNGEILSSSPVMPSGLVIDLSDNDEGTGVKDFGAETVTETGVKDFGAETVTETEVEDTGDENVTGVEDIGDGNVTGAEDIGDGMECDLSDVDSEDSDYVASEEDNDEVSDDASWMYEDLEGPDDDIFEVNSYRKVGEQPQPQPTNADVNTDEKWYSDPEDEDNLSLKGSSDEEGDGHPEFKDFHMANPILVEGMKFTGARQFREFLKEWNVVNGYDIEYKKNESTRITAVCRYGCTWRIHGSPIMRTTTFQIKSITGEHECGRQYDNRQANSSYIGKKLLDEIKDNPTINIASFKNKIRRKIMVDASRYQVYRAKRKATELIAGDIKEQYLRIWDYAETVRKHNPGSHIIIKTDPDTVEPTLQRMYFRVSAMKDGFLAGCRPIIGLDGCHLKGIYGGQLLTAVGRDGNDNMFPITVALVELESKDSWTWFLQVLQEDIGSYEEMGWTFISDRQKGLIETFNELLPGCDHRYCLRHIYSNFKVKFPGAFLKDLFWKAASTCSVSGFNYWMKKIEEADPKLNERRQTAAEWLRAVTPSLWARSHFSTRSKCDVVVNNISESFNSYILEARQLPIISMFEWIRKRVMQRIQVKKAGMEKYTGHLCPNIQEKIEKLKVESRVCVAAWCAIQKNKERVETYVHPYFTKSGYLTAYSYMIHPVPDMLDFVETGFQPLNPPNSKRGSGRPKKLRRRTVDEPRDPNKVTRRGLNVTCAKCMQFGHNKRSCKNMIHPKSKLVKNGQTSNATSQPMGTHTDVPPTIGTRIRAGRGATGRGVTTIGTGRGATGRGVTTVGIGRGRGAGSSQPPIGSSSQPVGRGTGRGVTGKGRGVGSTQPPTGSSSQPVGRGTGRGVTRIGAGRGGKASSSGPVGGPSWATVLQNIRAKKQARVTGM
ncbi:hypothetical protein RHGRI_012869 [Rhododendron griersonianum]|uniref:Transposase n=1 Tax=Rhododendron griersonianum TaxID=479676 RepID=A0AAV6K3P8_9ERIC|nr:hypothetical protein RHGRI_012869 [Rhododendron griersonianum]